MGGGFGGPVASYKDPQWVVGGGVLPLPTTLGGRHGDSVVQKGSQARVPLPPPSPHSSPQPEAPGASDSLGTGGPRVRGWATGRRPCSSLHGQTLAGGGGRHCRWGGPRSRPFMLIACGMKSAQAAQL